MEGAHEAQNRGVFWLCSVQQRSLCDNDHGGERARGAAEREESACSGVQLGLEGGDERGLRQVHAPEQQRVGGSGGQRLAWNGRRVGEEFGEGAALDEVSGRLLRSALRSHLRSTTLRNTLRNTPQRITDDNAEANTTQHTLLGRMCQRHHLHLLTRDARRAASTQPHIARVRHALLVALLHQHLQRALRLQHALAVIQRANRRRNTRAHGVPQHRDQTLEDRVQKNRVDAVLPAGLRRNTQHTLIDLAAALVHAHGDLLHGAEARSELQSLHRHAMIQRVHVDGRRACLARRLHHRLRLILLPRLHLGVRVAAEVQRPAPLLRLREGARDVLGTVAVVDQNLSALRVQRRAKEEVALLRQHQRLQEGAVAQTQRRRLEEQTARRQRHVQVHRARRETRVRHDVVLHPRDRLHVQLVLPRGERRHLRHAQNRVVELRTAEAERLLRLEPQRLALERVVWEAQEARRRRNQRLEGRSELAAAARAARNALAQRRRSGDAAIDGAEHARLHSVQTLKALQTLHDGTVERGVGSHLDEHGLRERLAQRVHGVGEAHGVRQVLHEVLCVDCRRVHHLLTTQRGEQAAVQRSPSDVLDRLAVLGHRGLHARRVEGVSHHQRSAEHGVALQLRAQRRQLRLVPAHRQRVRTIVAANHQLRVLRQVRQQLRLRQTHRRHPAALARVRGDRAPAVKGQLHRLLQRHRARRVRRADLAGGVSHGGGGTNAPRLQLLHQRQLDSGRRGLRHARRVHLVRANLLQQVPAAQLLDDPRALQQGGVVHGHRLAAVHAHAAPLRALAAEHEAHGARPVLQRCGANDVRAHLALAVALQRRRDRRRVAHHRRAFGEERAVRTHRPAERVQRGGVLRLLPHVEELLAHGSRRAFRLRRPQENELGGVCVCRERRTCESRYSRRTCDSR